MITFEKGKKAKDDLIVKINGHQLTYRELAEICVQLCKNEDKIYPFPYQGGSYLKNFLVECMDARDVTGGVLNKYHLNEKKEPEVSMKEHEGYPMDTTPEETQKSSPEKKSLSGVIDFPVPAPPMPKSVEEKS
jgi:hypothetical protein